MKRFLLLVALLSFLPQIAHAESGKKSRSSATENAVDPTQQFALPYAPPVEPVIQPVKFMEIQPPGTLQEHIDHLLYGIVVDIPPEYDHFGYEMRRYMAHVAGPEVLGNQKRIEEELKNIENAKIILKFWREDLMKKITAIETMIDEQNPPSNIRTSFKYNSGVVTAFLAECHVWLKKNEEVLTYLQDKDDSYTYDDPHFTFIDIKNAKQFQARYEAAHKALKIMNGYGPFGIMIY